MVRNLFLLLLLIILIHACKGDEGGGKVEVISSVISANYLDTIGVNEPLSLLVSIQTPNPCHEFSRFVVTENDEIRTIVPYTKYDPEEICITTLGRIDKELEVSFNRLGYHFLIFNPNSNFEIIDTVFVKN